LRSFERIEHAQQMLPLSEDDLRGALRRIAVIVLYQI
jgi:hypothetical protein